MPDQIGNGDDTRDPLIEEPMDYTPIGEGLRSRLVSVERERDERDREIEELKRGIGKLAGQGTAFLVRAERAEEQVKDLRGALALIEIGVPSDEHWHRMGDSTWANIGREAVRTARAALASSIPEESTDE